MAEPFQYAIVQVVPRVERGERLNAGIVLFSRPLDFLGARTQLDTDLLRAIAPGCDAGVVQSHLDVIEKVAAGADDGGPIAQLSQSERFHWMVAPSSTMIQASAQHTGLSEDPAAELEKLFASLVARG